MSTNRHIDGICCIVFAAVLVLTAFFVNAGKFGVQAVSAAMAYEGELFDTSYVHTIDIVMDDWDGFLETCENEEYEVCSLVIDGNACKDVGIRAKGNTSLSQVSAYGNNRYSFKVEFDHYDSSFSYFGLDKLSLNNIIQDNTYMKDYLTYQMMGAFGVDAPLCSYAYITVNGEDWGLYLAVEGVEDSFLSRNYGYDYGELYKPDSQSMGGGRGNGGGFDMDKFQKEQEEDAGDASGKNDENAGDASGKNDGDMGDSPEPPGDGDVGEPPETLSQDAGDTAGDLDIQSGESAESGMDNKADTDGSSDTANQDDESGMRTGRPQMGDGQNADGKMRGPMGDGQNADGEMRGPMGGGKNGGGPGGMGSDDVSLIYSDDDFDSYSNIFENAKTDVSDQDKSRLIASLKELNEGGDIEDVVDTEEVIRYFVVHNFVCNFDSYTGSMIHNYYLYEDDGKFSMIPWDYNLAFGGFQSGADADAVVNYPIDTPVSGGDTDSRPMLAWIFNDDAYTEQYHTYFSEFISEYFESGYFSEMIDGVSEMIAPYVEKDPTKFCTYEEFETGAQTLKQFCLLRAESVRGQLDGTIPSTSDGQAEDADALVDASSVTISDMGNMRKMGMG